MPRVIWKGAISFGLVHVPVSLVPASQESGIDFDWIDKRSLDPVGYRRVNKRTGMEIKREDIVKGIKQASGDYVILSEDEVAKAYPKTTQTIEIETFVKSEEIAFPYLEKPYFLTPVAKSEKVYALLREAMIEAGVIGIARVVMHTKERLAALIPLGGALMLNTIRWASELRSSEGLEFPPSGKSAAGLKDGELKMARQLIGDMTTRWKPDEFSDKFSDAIKALAAERVKAGHVTQVTSQESDESSDAPTGNVVDLTELLKRSLGTFGRSGGGKGGSGSAADPSPAGATSKGKKTSQRRGGATAKKAPAAGPSAKTAIRSKAGRAATAPAASDAAGSLRKRA